MKTIEEWKTRLSELREEFDQITKERRNRERDRQAIAVEALALKDTKAALKHSEISGQIIELVQREQAMREAIEGVESRILELEEEAERDRLQAISDKLTELARKEQKAFEKIEKKAEELKKAMSEADDTAIQMAECAEELGSNSQPVTHSRRYVGEFLAWKLGALPDRAQTQNRRPITENGFLWLEQWVPEFKGKSTPHRWGFEVIDEKKKAQAV